MDAWRPISAYDATYIDANCHFDIQTPTAIYDATHLDRFKNAHRRLLRERFPHAAMWLVTARQFAWVFTMEVCLYVIA